MIKPFCQKLKPFKKPFSCKSRVDSLLSEHYDLYGPDDFYLSLHTHLCDLPGFFFQKLVS